MTAPEFSRPVRIDTIGEAPRKLHVEAEEGERADLARRFGLATIDRLAADLTLSGKGDEISLEGAVTAKVVQTCVATGVPLEVALDIPFALLFRPQVEAAGPDEEIELGENELDVVFYDSGAIDVGEAVAETLLLNLDPYPRAPGAEEALKEAGVLSEEEVRPAGALSGLGELLKGKGRHPDE